MARLSILIPCFSDNTLLETTLLSVLSARGDGTEVIVIDRTGYADPYGLDGEEICLIRADSSASLCDLLQAGLRQARCEVVHLVGCGLEVETQWYEAALSWFDDERIGCVSPVVWATDNRRGQARALVGVKLSNGYDRTEVTLLGDEIRTESHGQNVLGPAWFAAFYRTDALRDLEAFDGEFGDELADIEIATALNEERFTCIVEPRTELSHARRCPSPVSSAITRGRNAHRFLLDHSDSPTSAGLHAIFREIVGGFIKPSRWIEVFGRMAEARRDRDTTHHGGDATRRHGQVTSRLDAERLADLPIDDDVPQHASHSKAARRAA